MTQIERRPDLAGRNAVTYPKDWGEPPEGQTQAEKRAWIAKNIAKGEERRAKGESVPWLAREVRS